MKFDGLFTPDYWDKLTAEDRGIAYNGCGPAFFPQWLRNLLSLLFHWGLDAVQIHDVEYSYSPTKLGADFRLLLNLLLRSKLHPWRISQAVLAFFGVVAFGRKAWDEAHKESKEMGGDSVE